MACHLGLFCSSPSHHSQDYKAAHSSCAVSSLSANSLLLPSKSPPPLLAWLAVANVSFSLVPVPHLSPAPSLCSLPILPADSFGRIAEMHLATRPSQAGIASSASKQPSLFVIVIPQIYGLKFHLGV